MATAVAHILVPLIAVSLFKDWYDSRHKNKFSLHYALIAGIAGVLPDIDILAKLFTDLTQLNQINPIFAITHTIFFPAFFLILFLVLKPVNAKARICNLGKHKLKLSTVSLMIFIGTIFHLILDLIFGNNSYLFYPFTEINFALNILQPLSYSWWFMMAMLDGVLLVLWLSYLQLKHKITDFI